MRHVAVTLLQTFFLGFATVANCDPSLAPSLLESCHRHHRNGEIQFLAFCFVSFRRKRRVGGAGVPARTISLARVGRGHRRAAGRSVARSRR